MPRPRILVINPNADDSVTDGLRRSMRAFDAHADIECRTTSAGPFGIDSDEDVERAAALVETQIREARGFDAAVIACYSDPGLTACRARHALPVFGMQESALTLAARHRGGFGVLAMSESSIRRHLVYIEGLGFSERLAAELPLDMTVNDVANAPDAADKVQVVGQRLIDEYGADVLILGCAGMTALRERTESSLGVPVIDPAQAAVQLALEAFDLPSDTSDG